MGLWNVYKKEGDSKIIKSLGSNSMVLKGIAGVEYKDKIFFSTLYPLGCLYCFDKATKATEFIQQFSVEVSHQGAMCHSGAVLYENKAWFIPWDTRRVACVNLDTFEETYFEIQNHDYKGFHAFVDYIIYEDNNLVLIPSGYYLDTLMVINMENGETICYPHVIPKGKCAGAYFCKDILYFVSSRGNVYAEFDWKTKKVLKAIPEGYDMFWKYNSVLQNKSSIYLIPYEAEDILILDAETGSKTRLPLPNSEDTYWKGSITSDGIILFPADRTRLFLKADMVSKKMTVVDDFFGVEGGSKLQCMTKISSGGKEFLAIATDGNIFYFDETGKLKERIGYAVEFDRKLLKSKTDRRITMDDIKRYNPDRIAESPEVDLNTFIIAVSRMEKRH